MKYLLKFSLFIFFFPALAGATCVLKQQIKEQKHFVCHVPGTQKSVHVLDLKGGFSETAYYHGFFLKTEIENGVLKGVQNRTEKAFAELSPSNKEKLLVIKRCVLHKYKESVSDEFKKGLKNLYRGLKDGGSKISWNEFEDSNYMIEFSIFADSMQRKMEENPSKEGRKIFSSCAPYFAANTLAKPFKILAKALRSIKMGCTGITASSTASSDAALVHGRNFDTGLLGFYEPEQVVVINRQKSGITSVGIASAGLHYAGGISGFNNQGLSVSLHELQTEGTEISHRNGSSDIAPYLLHSVLMKAHTLDDAIAIIKARKGFGAWTFLISDAKSNESASIELSGETVLVARRRQNTYLGQSNHFLGGKTQEQGYEYSLNKTLETRARLAHVERSLKEDFGRIDTQWVINHLTGHHDELTGTRSFGRTTTKVYTAATHVMLPAKQEWWMSVAESYPTNRSTFVGFRLNERNKEIPVEILGTTKAWENPGLGLWYDSMKYYVQAYLTNEKDHKTVAGLTKTLNLLSEASKTSLNIGVFEYPYEFMQARILVQRAARNILAGNKGGALKDLNTAQEQILKIKAQKLSSLHSYELFQLELWAFRAESLKAQTHQNVKLKSQAQKNAMNQINALIQKYPRQNELFDLQWSLKQKDQLYIVLDSDIRLGTVE